MPFAVRTVSVTLILALFLSGPAQAAQGTAAEPRPKSTDTQQPPELPVSLERIQRELARQPKLDITGAPADFRVHILEKLPRLEELFEGFDLRFGPVPYSGMTHTEFLAMVTPRDLRASNITPALDQLTVAVQTAVVKWLFDKAREKISTAREKREREAIQAEIDEFLRLIAEARSKRN